MKRISFLVLALSFLAITAFAQGQPKQINGGVLNGKATSLPKPDYPEGARAAGIVGNVRIAVEIDEAGNVVAAELAKDSTRVYNSEGTTEEVEAPDPILVDAALQAALQAKFSPTMLSGSPVRVRGVLVYNFRPTRVPMSGGQANEGLLNSIATSLPKPVYPPAAAAVRAGGTVSVRVVIDEEGNVSSAEAVQGHPLLRAAAVTASREAKFRPQKMSGKPVSISGVVVYNFVPPASKEQ